MKTESPFKVDRCRGCSTVVVSEMYCDRCDHIKANACEPVDYDCDDEGEDDE